MDKLGAMNAFAKVVALGSFAEAARTLGSTRSAVSKTVMELEHVLGVRLLDRTTRRVRTTEAGLAYYERCVDILARVEETEMQVSSLQAEPKGVLKVNGPTSFGALYLGPAVADFMAAYPELKIELTLTDHRPDRRGRRRDDPDCRDDQLERDRPQARAGSTGVCRFARLCCAQRRAGGARGSRAARLPDLRPYDHPAAMADRTEWRGRHGRDPFRSLFEQRRRAPVGRARGPGCRGPAVFLVGPDIEAGRLETVLDNFPQPELGVHAFYASNRYLAAKTRAFVDFLVKLFRDEPIWDRFRAKRL